MYKLIVFSCVLGTETVQYSQIGYISYIEIIKISVPPQTGCWPLPGHRYENILAPPLLKRANISSFLSISIAQKKNQFKIGHCVIQVDPMSWKLFLLQYKTMLNSEKK